MQVVMHYLHKVCFSGTLTAFSTAFDAVFGAIKGLSNDDLKEADGHWFHRAVQRLAEFFHHDDDRHAVTVCTMLPLSVPVSLGAN
jgi:hypothetical protein